ncbi:MAG: glycosyltransferase family A protein [Caldilineaceae bacterium]
MKQPRISVVVPVYNGARYLGAAIESILAQGWQRLELLVVDDGSTDQSVQIAEEYSPQVQCIRQANAGPGAARNRGVEAAQGEFLAFLDADDLWPPDKLALQIDYLYKHPALDMVFGQVEQFISPELPPEQQPAMPPQPIMTGLHVGAMLIRRQSFARVGPFATTWTIGEFIDWYGRAQRLGLQSANLPTIVMRRRLHTTNLTRRTQERRSDYLQIIKMRLDENRAGKSDLIISPVWSETQR